jgi:tetratricopeptide (TPR) repeat protein
MFLLSALQRRPDPSAFEAIHKEVHGELERSAKLDREQWLRVARTAPRDELIRALEEKMERYHALREAVGEDASLQTDIEIIIGRASAMIRLTRQEPPPVSAPAATEPAGPTKLTSAAPSVADGTPLDEDAVRAKVGTLLVEADLRMTVSDYANAVMVYERVVDLEPFVAMHHVKLAIAMTFWPRTAKQAEREFLEAVRLEPESAEIHYQFGLYYKAMRQRARAAAEMRAAVSLNPRNQRAREELEVLSPKDSALTSLKKLFR